MSMLTLWYNQCCYPQKSVSTVWRLKKRRRHFRHQGTPEPTPPGLGVSGKSELQRTVPYLSVSLFSTSRMTALMTLSSSMTLWVQMILRPSQSKSRGCECPEGLGNMLAMVQGHSGALLKLSLYGWIRIYHHTIYLQCAVQYSLH